MGKFILSTIGDYLNEQHHNSGTSYAEDLLVVSVPYYGFNGDFDPDLFHEIISYR